jgi:hypothetical protein
MQLLSYVAGFGILLLILAVIAGVAEVAWHIVRWFKRRRL